MFFDVSINFIYGGLPLKPKIAIESVSMVAHTKIAAIGAAVSHIDIKSISMGIGDDHDKYPSYVIGGILKF